MQSSCSLSTSMAQSLLRPTAHGFLLALKLRSTHWLALRSKHRAHVLASVYKLVRTLRISYSFRRSRTWHMAGCLVLRIISERQLRHGHVYAVACSAVCFGSQLASPVIGLCKALGGVTVVILCRDSPSCFSYSASFQLFWVAMHRFAVC